MVYLVLIMEEMTVIKPLIIVISCFTCIGFDVLGGIRLVKIFSDRIFWKGRWVSLGCCVGVCVLDSLFNGVIIVIGCDAFVGGRLRSR